MVSFGYQVQNNTTRATTPASTDQGNVSYECPSWQEIFGIPSNGAFPHTAGFTGGARPEASFEGCLLNIEGIADGWVLRVDRRFPICKGRQKEC